MARRKRPEHGKVLPRVNVEVYPDEEAFVRQARAYAIAHGMSFHDMVMAALRRYMEQGDDA
jgi:hypothetical protein